MAVAEAEIVELQRGVAEGEGRARPGPGLVRQLQVRGGVGGDVVTGGGVAHDGGPRLAEHAPAPSVVPVVVRVEEEPD